MTYTVEEERANREETKERRKRLTDVKRAARLIEHDFTWASAAIKTAIENKQWVGGYFEPIRLQSWNDYRSVLAAETNIADWVALKAAVRAMESFQRLATLSIMQKKPDIDASGLRLLENKREAVEKGRAALKPCLDLAID